MSGGVPRSGSLTDKVASPRPPMTAPGSPAGATPRTPGPRASSPLATAGGTGASSLVGPTPGDLPPGPAGPNPAASPGHTDLAATPIRSATPIAAPAVTPRRAINPFLANDPNAKARRLARALISDLVTYFPQRRDEGLRDGTLRELFREEIKKSYEEYVTQVGGDFADSTPHFKEALNEILAGGRDLF